MNFPCSEGNSKLQKIYDTCITEINCRGPFKLQKFFGCKLFYQICLFGWGWSKYDIIYFYFAFLALFALSFRFTWYLLVFDSMFIRTLDLNFVSVHSTEFNIWTCAYIYMYKSWEKKGKINWERSLKYCGAYKETQNLARHHTYF